jgi:hypothetical protein
MLAHLGVLVVVGDTSERGETVIPCWRVSQDIMMKLVFFSYSRKHIGNHEIQDWMSR